MPSQDDDAVRMYLGEFANLDPLTKDEERTLFQKVRRGGEPAQNAERRLIESKLALVVTIAQRHSSAGVPMLDLIQEGNCALMRVITSFASSPTGDFSAHASACIEEAILKTIAERKDK